MANQVIQIGNKQITEDCSPFFIAEIGINHNGEVSNAKKLIDASFACGWDSVKFQKRTPELCVPPHQKNQPKDTPWGKMTYLQYKHKIEFEKPEYDYIDRYCQEKPISWSASVWDIPSLEFLLAYQPDYLKIPSAKLTDDELLAMAAQSRLPVLVSTGMCVLEEIDTAVNLLEKHSNGNYVLLHTNSAYPAPLEQLNLRMIHTLRDRYRCIVGYSGHEYNLEPTVIAASMGAKVIERHITLDHDMWGSDQAASLEIHAMYLLKRRILSLSSILGDGIKMMTDLERTSRKKLSGKPTSGRDDITNIPTKSKSFQKLINSPYDIENIYSNIGL